MYTELFTNAHEFGWYKENLNNPAAMMMDLHNNQLGITIGEKYPKSRLIEFSKYHISIGNAMILKNNKCVFTTPYWGAK